jgi:protein involved in polysaccharide export with SLBB domain
LGETNQPGSYEYRAGLSIVGVVALAGGFTYRAATSRITVERRGCPFAAEPDTPLAPDDIVTVPERFF